MSGRPFDFLIDSIVKEVLINLKENMTVRGKLVAFDVHMNLVLEKAETLENNEPKTKYGKLMVRGDNVLMISP